MSKKIKDNTSKQILEIITDWNKTKTNFKILKYIWDDWVLEDEKNPSYMNNFTEYLIDYNEFYEILPKDIKENLTEKFYRFVEKQEIFKKQKTFEKIETLDQYYHFLWSKINFPKIWIKLILDYYKNNWFIELNLNEKKKIFEIKLTKKWKKTFLWLNNVLKINNEYEKIEWELKEKIVKMIHRNLMEWNAKLDQIKDELFEEWIMVHKKKT